MLPGALPDISFFFGPTDRKSSQQLRTWSVVTLFRAIICCVVCQSYCFCTVFLLRHNRYGAKNCPTTALDLTFEMLRIQPIRKQHLFSLFSPPPPLPPVYTRMRFHLKTQTFEYTTILKRNNMKTEQFENASM